MTFTKASKEFLDKCKPGMGNLLVNTRKGSPQDPDFIGFARMEDGLPVRIEGVSKTSAKGHRMLSIKVAMIPGNIYSDNRFEGEVPNYQPNTEFLDGNQ